jgi:DNA polymerase-1
LGIKLITLLRNSKHRQSGDSRTIGGRRRLWEDSPPLTELLNTPVQGTSADITKQALILFNEIIGGYEGKIIGTIHDEIILENARMNAED